MKTRAASASLVLLLAAVTACSGRGQEAMLGNAAATCSAVDMGLAESATLTGMAGDYLLTMVKRDGPDRATTVTGPLRLTARPAGSTMMRGAATPLQGTAELDLEAVGAHRVGSLDSADPTAPGVLVMEQSGTPPTIMLRFGSNANRTDRTAFDGAFTALTVHRAAGGAFAGSWRSGVGMDVVEGYFCAVRR